MYESFYGVGERPFTLLPDPDFLFLSDKHQAALDMLEMAITSHSGFCVVSGEIGAGKTTLIRAILNRLDDSVRVGLVSNTHPSFGELMQWTMAAYGLPCGTSDKLELHKQFVDFVIQQYAENKHTLLIIDEAQNLSLSSLEELRMLSNVNSEKDLVLQIILVGQQQLREKLANPALQQLAQRVELDYHLEGLSEAEVRKYIQHRLRRAGGNPELFSEAACSAVYRESAGIPRRVNRLCELCMVYGCAEERLSIDAELVSRVSEDQRKGRLLSGQEVASQERPQTSSRIDAAPAGMEVLASESAVHDDAGPEKRPATGGSVASQDIVNEMSSVFLAKHDSGNPSSAEESPPADTVTELHKLVVNAEKQQQSSKGERSALWLLVGIAAMVGITGWMTRDLWIGDGLISAESGVETTVDPAPSKAELERKAERLARSQEEARQLELERKVELQRKERTSGAFAGRSQAAGGRRSQAAGAGT